MTVTYLKGDATQPQGEGKKLIVHVCNDIGAWGAGFTRALSQRWAQPEAAYRSRSSYELGVVEYVPVDQDTQVVNMIAQAGIGRSSQPRVRYPALEQCLLQVGFDAQVLQASVHMPRIGCGLAGGKWENVEPIIQRVLFDVPVFVYDLP